MFAVNFKRIVVEVTVALQGNTDKRSVEQLPLQRIGISRVSKSQIHILVEKAARHGRADFAVSSLVWQIVIGTEAFNLGYRHPSRR